MTRSLKIYQGEDETPVVDVTEPSSNVHVIWEEVEAGGRAFRGESNLGTFPMRDERGETGSELNLPSGLSHISLSAGSRIEWLVTDSSAQQHRLFRGRIGPKDYTRGRQKADRAREVTVSANDTNYDLRNIIVDGWSRPQETDVARVQALITDYLSGSPRASTTIASTYVATGSNTVTLGPKVYDATSPADILSEIATIADKLHFVTIDDELFYDGYDSTTYLSGIRISDRIDELNTDGDCTLVEGLAYDLDFEGSGSGGSHTVDIYPSGSDTWPNGGGNTGIVNNNPVGHNGSYCVSWGASFVDHGPCSPLLPATPGVTYRWTLWASATHETPVLLQVRFFADDGSPSASDVPLASHDLATDVPADWGGWTEYTGDFTAPEGTDFMELHAEGGWGVGVGGAYDDVTVEPIGVGEGATTFPPIWDVGPSSTEDGMELLSGLRLYYGQGSNTYVYVNDPTTANQYWHSEQSLYTNDPLINTPAKATSLAQSILQHRKFERRTYNVSIGPLTEDQVGCLKPGHLIDIKARAIPDADDQYVSRRIAQLRWTTPVPGTYFAHMMLDRPMKDAPSGIGPKSATDSINRHVEQGSNSHPEYVLRGTLTTQGDLPYRGASDWTRLAIGASNTWLKSIGNVPVWASLPASSGGSGIAVEEDGVEEGTGIDRLNFSTNLNVSVSGSEATITADSGGGGSLTQAYVGKNAVGASWENGGTNLVQAKKVTLANACLMTDIEAYIRWHGSAAGGQLWLSLWDDNGSGTAPDHMLAYLSSGPNAFVLLDASGSGTDGRWMSLGLGRWLTAGDYWIAFTLTSSECSIAYDSGSDRKHGYAASVSQYGIDWGFSNASWSADADSGRDFSIRANTIR